MLNKPQDTLKVLIVCDQNSEIETILNEVFANDEGFIEILHANSVESGIESIVINTPDITLVHDVDTRDRTRELLTELEDSGLKNELGINNSIIAVVGVQHIDIENEIINLGGKGIISNSLYPEVLRLVIHTAVELKHIKATLRADKGELIHQLFDMRDSRERETDLAHTHTNLADELYLVRRELENSIDDKKRIFSIIAHDLRSPFLPLLAYTEMISLEAHNLPIDKLKEYADNAFEAGNRVYKLLENLLEWSLVQMDRVDCNPGDYNIDTIVTEVFDILEPVASEKSIRLIKSNTDTSAFLDKDMISSVLRNLINNAIKFSYEGDHIELSVSECPHTNGEFLEVTVADQGVGIDSKKARLLFTNTMEKKSKGTNGEPGSGLGLSICKELVERNGGSIWFNSEPGKGSEFTFSLKKIRLINPGLNQVLTTVYRQCGPGDEPGIVGSQEQHAMGNLFRFAQTADGNLWNNHFVEDLFRYSHNHFRTHISRCDGVNRDAFGGGFQR